MRAVLDCAAKLKGRTWGWSPSQVARYQAGHAGEVVDDGSGPGRFRTASFVFAAAMLLQRVLPAMRGSLLRHWDAVARLFRAGHVSTSQRQRSSWRRRRRAWARLRATPIDVAARCRRRGCRRVRPDAAVVAARLHGGRQRFRMAERAREQRHHERAESMRSRPSDSRKWPRGLSARGSTRAQLEGELGQEAQRDAHHHAQLVRRHADAARGAPAGTRTRR